MFNFWVTLLDAYQNYLDAANIYDQFWGFSENPKFTLAEFEEKSFDELIAKLNREPQELSEAAERGTAFNEVLDAILEWRSPANGVEVEKIKDASGKVVTIRTRRNGFQWDLPARIFSKMARNLSPDAVAQIFTEREITSGYGKVRLYGYVDYVCNDRIIDVKTTNRYNAFKYRKSWQKTAYPYLLSGEGTDIQKFEFLATDFKRIYSEVYNFRPETDLPKLYNHIDSLIEFIEANKDIINNDKLNPFN